MPDTKTLNVKQGRAFLYIAWWLQERMTAQWVEAGQLPKTELAKTEMSDAINGLINKVNMDQHTKPPRQKVHDKW